MTLQPAWRWRALLTRFAIALGIMAIATGSTFGYAYWFANDQFDRATKIDLPPDVLRENAKPTDPANYLIVGSDSRSFVHDQVAADHFGTTRTNPENLADVIMIAHVDPNTPGKGFLVSIPRDIWVAIPGHGNQKINAAFNFGKTPSARAALLIQTLAQNFKVHIDHYVKVDFATFTGVVNAIGHVPIFFPAQAYDHETGLKITTPGCVQLDGLQALMYARSRYYQYRPSSNAAWANWTGSDLDRIKRQQYFIRSLAQEAIKKGAHNPLTARAIVEKIVPNLEVDSHLQLSDFLSLVRAFRGVDPGAVQMVTVPTRNDYVGSGPHPTAIQRVKPEAEAIFSLLGGFTRTPVKTAPVKPSSVTVQVLNGSGVKNIAANTEHALQVAGFANGGAPGDADNHAHDLTLVRYTGNNIAKARAVAAYLGGVGLVTRSATALGAADVVVVTGADFTAVVKPGTHPSPASTSTSTPTVTTAFANPGTTPGVTVPNFGGRPPVGCG